MTPCGWGGDGPDAAAGISPDGGGGGGPAGGGGGLAGGDGGLAGGALLKLLCCFSTQISHIWYPLSVFLRFSL